MDKCVILNSVLIIGLIIFVVTFVAILIIVNNRNLYCAIFMHTNRKLWKYLIENAFQFKQTYKTEENIWLEWDGYELIVNKYNELVSVHKNDECILGYFDVGMSDKMYNTLKVLGKI